MAIDEDFIEIDSKDGKFTIKNLTDKAILLNKKEFKEAQLKHLDLIEYNCKLHGWHVWRFCQANCGLF